MYESFLENIRYYKNKANISVEELSMRTKLSTSYLYSLLKGTRNKPSLDTINKIATALNVDIMDLIGIK